MINGIIFQRDDNREYKGVEEDRISQDNNMILEQGDFTIYKLYEITL